jgi:hypothetical protein
MSTLDLSEYIRIVNNTGKTIKARYDGKEYVFNNGEPTDVHQLAAAHIFGFGQDDKTNAFHRLGWLATNDQSDALEKLKLIEFGDVPSPAVSITTAPKHRGRPRISKLTPLATADADDGGEASASLPADAIDDEAIGDI